MRKLNYEFIIKSLFIALITFISITHIIAFITSSFAIGVYLGIASLILIIFYNLYKKPFDGSELKFLDLIPFIFSLIVSILMYFFDKNIGQADAIHIAISSTLAKNLTYPPLFPPGPELDFSFYHYGVDILSSSLSYIFKLDPWDACSISIAIGSFLCINSLYLLFKSISKTSVLNSFLATVLMTFISTTSALEYFIREVWKFDPDFLVNLTKVSTLSVTLISYQLRYFSQNFSLGLAFFLLYLIFTDKLEKNGENQNLAKIFILLISSFVLYFCFPAYWYPIFVGVIAIAIFKLDTSWTIKAITLLVSKFIPTGDAITSINNYKITTFKPSLEWIRHVSGLDLQYFFSREEFLKLYTHLDKTTGATSLSVPLFSELSFREFGFIFIVAIAIFIYRIWKERKIGYLDFFVGTGLVSLSVPFLIEFPIRQIEMSRFITWGKFLCLIYIILFTLSKIEQSKLTKIGLYLLSFFFFISSVLTIIPSTKIWGQEKFARIMDPELKQIILDLSKLHKPGQYAADNLNMYKASDMVNLAGFYGAGAQLYHTDFVTRDTIFKTASIKLLQELKIKYLLVNDFSRLSIQAQENLKTNLKLVKAYSDRRFLFEVNKDSQVQDYSWVLTSYKGSRVILVKDSSGKVLNFDTKKEALSYLDHIKSQSKELATDINYIWLGAQAIPK